MSVLRSVTAAGLIALTLGGAALTSAETANAGSRAVWGGVAAGLVGGAIAAEALRPAYEPAPAYGYYPVRYYDRHCFWDWRRDRWGHRHHIRICR
jgi:hypothetical protein